MPDRTQDELARYWDDLTLGNGSGSPDLDPSLEETVRRFEQARDVPGPAPSFVAHLMEELVYARALPTPATPSRVRLGRLSIRPRTGPTPFRLIHGRGSRWLPALVAAALIVAVLGAVFRQIRNTDDDTRFGSGAPAIQAPASPSPEASPSGDQTLVEITLPADIVPAGESVSIYLMRDIIPANTEAVREADSGTCCPGVKVYEIITGSVTVVVDGPAWLIPAGGSDDVAEIAPGEELDLNEGDAVAFRYEHRNSWTSGDAPVEVLSGAVYAGWSPGAINPTAWEFYEYSTETAAGLPGGPYTLSLQTVVFDPGEKLALPETGITQLGIREKGGVAVSSEDTLSVTQVTEPTEVYVLLLENAPAGTVTPIAGADVST